MVGEFDLLEALYRPGTVKRNVADLILKTPGSDSVWVAEQCQTTTNVVHTVKAELRRNGLLAPRRISQQVNEARQPISVSASKALPISTKQLPESSGQSLSNSLNEYSVKLGKETYDMLTSMATTENCTLEQALHQMLVGAAKERPPKPSEMPKETLTEKKAVESSDIFKDEVLQDWKAELEFIISQVFKNRDRVELFEKWKKTFAYDHNLGNFLVGAFDEWFAVRATRLVDMGDRRLLEYRDPKTGTMKMPLHISDSRW